MKKIYHSLFLFLCLALSGIPSVHADIRKAFVNAPFHVIPTIPESIRLDMLDYYDSGVERASSSYFSDDVMITSLDNNTIELKTSNSCRLALYTTVMNGDTLYVAIETIGDPVNDSNVKVYDRNWKKLWSAESGEISAWLTKDAVKKGSLPDIENAIGFITATATFHPDTSLLVFDINLDGSRIDKKDIEKIRPDLKSQRRFKLSSGGFKETNI